MPIKLPLAAVVILNVAGWPMIQMTLAWTFLRLPVAWFRPPPPARWEQRGRFYEHWFQIKRWKDRLPDAARWFGGGFTKGSLGGRDPTYLARFRQELWRGELCHWAALACTPVFFLWNPLWADWVMLTYAVAFNLPCVLSLRYNRARFHRLVGRRSAAS